jgi:protein-tyrosine kinase
MSKFFNETTKGKQARLQDQGVNLESLEDFGTEKEQTRSHEQTDVAQAVSVAPAILEEAPQKVTLPQSIFLSAQFSGSEAIRSAEESYRVLRTRLLRLSSSREFRSTVITSSVQGEGKTLTSLNLALSCCQLQNTRVLLVDGDIRTARLTQAIGIASEGLADVLSGRCDPQSAILETNQPNLFVCGAGFSAHPPAELYAGGEWREFIEHCRDHFDLVLIDAPPVLNLSDVELMTAACDGVLLVVRASHTRRDMLQKVASQIEPKKLIGLVYNFSEGPHHKYYYA